MTVALLLGALFTSAHPRKDCTEPMHEAIPFRGTVRSVEMLGQRAVTLFPVDFDMNYVVTIHVDSVSVENPMFHAGEDVVFGIHSPALTFFADDPLEGQTFELVALATVTCDGQYKGIEQMRRREMF